MMWIRCNSHRARGKLLALTGPLDSYGRWPDGEWPFGEYYEVDDSLRETVDRIKGLQIMARKPADLFKRVSFA